MPCDDPDVDDWPLLLLAGCAPEMVDTGGTDSVELALQKEMCESNTSVCTAWVAHATGRAWSLAGAGSRTVYVLLWLGMLSACHPGATQKIDGDDSTAGDSARDTGITDIRWPDPGEVTATIEAGATVACENPTAPPLLHGTVPDSDWQRQFRGSLEQPTGWGLVVEDLDGDGRLDVFLPQPGADELLMGDGAGGFWSAPFPDGADDSYGASAADYDNDGDPDLFVANAGPDRLYRNDSVPGAPAFTDVTAAAGIAPTPWLSVSSAWADMDNDGDLDLAVGNYHTSDEHAEEIAQEIWIGDPNELYENNGDGTFTDRSGRLTGLGSDGWTYGIAWLDMDGDVDPDLYVVNDKGDIGGSNRLLINNGAGVLTDDNGARYTDLAIQGMGQGIGDLNDDLQPDIFLSNSGSLAFLSSAGDWTWYESAQAMALFPDHDRDQYIAWGGAITDMDNDGLSDIFVAFGFDDLDGPVEGQEQLNPEQQPDALFIQHTDMTIPFAHEEQFWDVDQTGVSRGSVLADINGDGVPDLLVRDIFAQTILRLSRCSDHAWISLRLSQPAVNRAAIGARVSVTVGDHRQTLWITAGSTGIASSEPALARFGLGAATQIDRIDVLWPDGATSALAGPIPVNAPLRVVRAE